MEVVYFDIFIYIINSICFLIIGMYILSYFLICDYIEFFIGLNVWC